MLEGNPAVAANPKAQRMLERFQGMKARKDRWFQQGYEDGENWASETAAADELRNVLNDWDTDDDSQYEFDDMDWPESFDYKTSVKRWLQTSEGMETQPRTLRDISKTEQDAYIKGWHKAVRELWKAAGPSLSWITEED